MALKFSASLVSPSEKVVPSLILETKKQPFLFHIILQCMMQIMKGLYENFEECVEWMKGYFSWLA